MTTVKHHKYPLYATVCICFLFMLFGGHWLYFTPTAEISIDINPSIEMSINRFDHVIDINDFNEDGRKLADSLNIKYMNYADAVEQVLNNDTITALLSNNEVMTITVTGADGQQSAKILSGVEAFAEKRRNTYCFYASSEEVADAHEMGLSCGKYRAFLELQLLDPNITPEAVQEMTMREIRDLIDRLSTDNENNSSSYDNWQNGHHGYGGGHGRGWRNRRTEQQNAGEQQSQPSQSTVKVGCQPVYFSLDGFLLSCYFSRNVATLLVTVSIASGQ